MHVILCDPSGHRHEGIVLAASRYRLRVMLRGDSDITEIRREFDQWIGERGEQLTVEALAVAPGLDLEQFCRTAAPRTFAVGYSPAKD
jgi:hypothetical protein